MQLCLIVATDLAWGERLHVQRMFLISSGTSFR